MGGFGQILTFAYIVGGWVKQDAYVIKKITEKMDFQKTPNLQRSENLKSNFSLL